MSPDLILAYYLFAWACCSFVALPGSAQLVTAHVHFHCATVTRLSEAGSPFSWTVRSFFLSSYRILSYWPVWQRTEKGEAAKEATTTCQCTFTAGQQLCYHKSCVSQYTNHWSTVIRTFMHGIKLISTHKIQRNYRLSRDLEHFERQCMFIQKSQLQYIRVLTTLQLLLRVAYYSSLLLSPDDYTQVHQYKYGLPGHKTVILAWSLPESDINVYPVYELQIQWNKRWDKACLCMVRPIFSKLITR